MPDDAPEGTGYPDTSSLRSLVTHIERLAELKHERGAQGLDESVQRAHILLESLAKELVSSPEDDLLAEREPNDIRGIRAQRPDGPRRLHFSHDGYRDRLEGAFLARCAGCTLGAPVEFWPIARMEALAREHGQPFPPRDFFAGITFPFEKRYETSPRRSYTRGHIDGVPVDDDLVYTVLGLLILEDYGADFTTRDVADAWLRYLPFACTAEEIALANLRNGVDPLRAADVGNPYCDWIGAAIRADPWGYVAPAWPEKAAEMAHRDAYLSHRRQGIYSEMFFSASVAAAFAVDDPIDALQIGLTEIPSECAFRHAVEWALAISPEVKDYRTARSAVEDRFQGMHPTHAVNNACLTVFGLTIGGTDVTRVIGETVAMGMDNDCTAATAGSIVGAVVGKSRVPEHWYRDFDDTINTYLIDRPELQISDLVERFASQAQKILG